MGVQIRCADAQSKGGQESERAEEQWLGAEVGGYETQCQASDRERMHSKRTGALLWRHPLRCS